MNPNADEYDIWVKGENEWTQYTVKPFASVTDADRWARRYIPEAHVKIVLRSTPAQRREG